MEEANAFSQEQKTESLRKALIGAGYDMAAYQAESMEEDHDSWHEHIINGKINPKCIDISDQAGHSFYNDEMDIWFEPDEEIFPEEYDECGLNGLIETNGISDDEVFDLLYEGANNFIKKSTARIGKRNIQSQSTSNSIIMNQYNYSKKA